MRFFTSPQKPPVILWVGVEEKCMKARKVFDELNYINASTIINLIPPLTLKSQKIQHYGYGSCKCHNSCFCIHALFYITPC